MLHSFSTGVLFYVNKLNTLDEHVEIDYDRSSLVITKEVRVLFETGNYGINSSCSNCQPK